MTRITIAGWREGLNKVRLNHLLREQAGYSLGDAKRAVDRLLDGESVSFELPNPETATAFCHAAQAIGADCSAGAGDGEDAGASPRQSRQPLK